MLGRVLVLGGLAELVVRVVVVAQIRVVVDALLLGQQSDFVEDEVEDPLERVDFEVQVAGGDRGRCGRLVGGRAAG